ncbi:hypothetical protein DFQ05_0526 [Winogradskyella wandonensis]|uniref:Uncharacterized protein n=1 Tax=Winogradskyella wandonensis TaxID=1442586 RepID=A0A4R1KV05_9FLAO|nr:collagen-like protein [Winogradskyella wandonensis]TCK69015.1 hypothetical protein DFQ05_0526 [Winogradskyella wandonensis]
MKRILTLITAFTLVFTACEGPQGPPGFDGFDGQDGRDGIAIPPSFEIVVDFNAANNYEYVEAYGFDVSQTDITLVYILWDTLDDGTEIWRLMPQTVIFEDGNDLVYNFDFTLFDVRFFLEGSDLDGLANVWTQDQVFRVVVIPANNVGRADYSDINSVIETYNIESFPRR